MNNSIYKEELFSHINGMVLISALNALIKTNLINIFIKEESFSINSIYNNKKVKNIKLLHLKIIYFHKF